MVLSFVPIRAQNFNTHLNRLRIYEAAFPENNNIPKCMPQSYCRFLCKSLGGIVLQCVTWEVSSGFMIICIAESPKQPKIHTHTHTQSPTFKLLNYTFICIRNIYFLKMIKFCRNEMLIVPQLFLVWFKSFLHLWNEWYNELTIIWPVMLWNTAFLGFNLCWSIVFMSL